MSSLDAGIMPPAASKAATCDARKKPTRLAGAPTAADRKYDVIWKDSGVSADR
jgi:hypothetical protein